jgi:hypothetical protein
MWLLTMLLVLGSWTLLAFPLAVVVGRSLATGSRPARRSERPAMRQLISG